MIESPERFADELKQGLRSQGELARRGLGRTDFELPPDWFHEGQLEAWASEAEVVLILAGRQSGKTVSGPRWLIREMARKGPGDYAVVGPTLELLKKKALPEFRKVFEREEQLGTYNISDRIFIFSDAGLMKVFGRKDEPCTVFIGYATKPDSLESATYKAVWADEAGQTDFKQSSWEALEGRRAVHNGRILVTTTPYAFNWLKYSLFDKWLDGSANQNHLINSPTSPYPTWISVTRFESWMNPTFSREKFDAIRGRIEGWKFDLFYRAIFTRPAGAIYDCFDQKLHCVSNVVFGPSGLIPRHWRRHQGVDFGNVNTASNWAAIDPKTGIAYVYRTYHDGSKSAGEHVKDWEAIEPLFFEKPKDVFAKGRDLPPPLCYGGSPSENDWRDEFAQLNYAINKPAYSDVETGIARVYALLKSGRLKILNSCLKLIAEIETYARKLNEAGEPLAEIEDKASFHRADALRYLCAGISLDVDEGEAVQYVNRISEKKVESLYEEDPDEDEPEEKPKPNGRTEFVRRQVVRR